MELESLLAAVRAAKLKESRRKKNLNHSTEILANKFSIENSDQQCFEAFVKFQQSFLQNSILYNDAVQEQETAQKKRKPVSNFSEPPPRYDAEKSKNSDPRLSKGIVFREPPRCDAEKPQKSKPEKIHESREERLNHEKSLKKPMICNGDDNNQEKTAQRKRKMDHNFEKKNVDSGIMSRRPLPEEVRMKIVQKAVEGGEPPEMKLEPVLVIQKVLQMSDILKDQNRITIPQAQLENVFLSDEEDQYLHIKHAGRTNYVIVPTIEPSGRVPQLNLRRWNVGKNSVSYVLNGGWKDVVAYNHLEEGQTVQLWAFRVKGALNLAFVILSDIHHHQQQKQEQQQMQQKQQQQEQQELQLRQEEQQEEKQQKQKKQRSSSVEVAMSAAQALALISRHQNNALKSASASDRDGGETSTSRSEDSEMRWTIDLNADPREVMDACCE